MLFLEICKAAFLGIVQGITEWLPVSSTGHMILVDEFLHLGGGQDFVNLFLILIQFGSILAVVTLFFHKLNPFSPRKKRKEKEDTMVLWFKVLVATVPAGVIGVLFDEKIEAIFFNPITVATTLILYGVLFLFLESGNKKPRITELHQMSFQTAALIGVFQILSLIPGTSRSGSTILGAIFLGTSRYIAAEFSFFMAIPVMFGASLIKILKYIKNGLTFGSAECIVLASGMIVAYVVSLLVIRFLMDYVKKHSFKPFGYYRILLGLVVLLYFFIIQ